MPVQISGVKCAAFWGLVGHAAPFSLSISAKQVRENNFSKTKNQPGVLAAVSGSGFHVDFPFTNRIEVSDFLMRINFS